MRSATSRLETLQSRVALGLIAFALLLRILIPAGFMPAEGKGLAITLCTGMGAVQAWLDDQGRLHKDKPAPDQKIDHPCAFAGFGVALGLPDLLGRIAAPLYIAATPFAATLAAVAIGRGLAAPPPPPTGPPSRL